MKKLAKKRVESMFTVEVFATKLDEIVKKLKWENIILIKKQIILSFVIDCVSYLTMVYLRTTD